LKPGSEKWAKLKAAYEDDEMSVDKICDMFQLSRGKFYALVKRNNWPRRRVEKSPDFLVRLMQVLEAGLAQVERRIDEEAIVDAVALSNLTKTYEKHLQLQSLQAVEHSLEAPSELDIARIRERLLAHINDDAIAH
jgi:hypothetical protein